MRLDKYLAHAGLGTRKEVKQLIRKGFVKVNQELCTKDDQHIQEDIDEVRVYDEVISYEKKIYIMLNKPEGYISAVQDAHYPTVIDLIDLPAAYGLFPIGRLDIDTTGLLLISNDGALAHQLLSPKKHIPKVYEVTIQKPLSEAAITLLESGQICLDGKQLQAAKVSVLAPCKILLTIHEGKYHQVKRMLTAVDNEVVQLKRIQMGALPLDPALSPKDWRYLKDFELLALQQT